MLTIREALEADAETCSRVLCGSIRELCLPDHKGDAGLIARWTGNKTPEGMARWIANPRATLFLAEHDGSAAGVGAISEDGEVLLNYVDPGHRFAGVSRTMLAHLEAALRERGLSMGKLTSTETAHRFYRDAGWRDAGEPQEVFGLKGYPMVKNL